MVTDSDELRIVEVKEKNATALLLDGYTSASCAKITCDDVEYEVTTFQGDHKDEYMVKELKTGRCQLFCKGIITLAWMVSGGIRIGGFTLYEKGKVLKTESWDTVKNRRNCRYLEKCDNVLILVVRAGDNSRIVYRGGFDNPYSMKREGEGYAYDETSGRVLLYGVWKEGQLFQIFQEFQNESVMIEYEIEKGKENVTVLNRHPVYEGGYVYDEKKDKYYRNGRGCLININTGMGETEGEWTKGVLTTHSQLFNGWEEKGMDVSFRSVAVKSVTDYAVSVKGLNEWKNLVVSVRYVTIASNCCNEDEMKAFDLSAFKQLKSIVIGDDCFGNVSDTRIIGLNQLESVVVGKNSFTKQKNGSIKNKNSKFYLMNCPLIRELKMGCYSFSDYSLYMIENVNSLEVIEMGELNAESFNFYYANFQLKSNDDMNVL